LLGVSSQLDVGRGMTQKLFRDPLYDYIGLDKEKESWLLNLINCPELQRLRYINQLGLSHFTYPGSTHSRFSHSFGMFHLMQECLEYLNKDYGSYFKNGDKEALLAATLLHDIGHGPFSHTTETFFGKHASRSVQIITSSESAVNKILTEVDRELPSKVAALVSEEIPKKNPPVLWQRALISSQLDLDRLDFLRRDSLFSGAEYGNFDWYRIIHTMRLTELTEDIQKIWVFWPDKTKYAIEEYLFSRFYMYQSVYFHHTTRGFEKVLEKILRRAKWLALQNGSTFGGSILPSLKPFFQEDKDATLQQFLGLTDYAVLAQVWEWKNAEDDILSDLAGKFFGSRDEGFKVACEFDLMREVPMLTKIPEKVEAARKYLKEKNLEPDYYLLSDEFDVEVYKPYAPELEELQTTPENMIMISDGTKIREISNLLPRLKPIAQKLRTARYYCPEEYKEEIKKLLS